MAPRAGLLRLAAAAAVAAAGARALDPRTTFEVGGLAFSLRDATGTVADLRDAQDHSGFSFTPNDTARLAPGWHHLGDVNLRVRSPPGGGAWATVRTADSTLTAPIVAPLLPGSFWSSDVSALVATPLAPGLVVRREWGVPADNLGVQLATVLLNNGSAPLEVGAAGISLVGDNNWNGLTLEQNAAQCSLMEAYIGADGGFAKATRISGAGPVLMVAPLHGACASPTGRGLTSVAYCGAPLNAWRPLHEDATPGVSVSFEGLYEYTMVTGAWVGGEWAGVQPWVDPSTLVLQPGQAAVFPLRLWSVQQGLADTEPSLTAAGMPLARGVPGYVLPEGTTSAVLLLTPPAGGTLTGVSVSPAGALTVGTPGPAAASGAVPYPVAPAPGYRGRARVNITYAMPAGAPALTQVVTYLVIAAPADAVAAYSAFTASRAWFNDTSDPFGRAFSALGWDATGGPQGAGAPLVQEGRVFVAGLSDEAGAGANLGYAAHAAGSGADALAVAMVATYANRTLAGQKPDGEGTPVSVQDPATMGIRASMFWGTPDDRMKGFNYTNGCMTNPTWACWDEPRGEALWRSYNYPHQAMVYLSLYRLARNWDALPPPPPAWGLDGLAPPEWYLNRSAHTFIAMNAQGNYNSVGLMVGSAAFGGLLDALAGEAAADPSGPWGWPALLAKCDGLQQARTQQFLATPFPYGSEMPWDSTGQEEVFTFAARYAGVFGNASYHTANLTVAATKAYTPWDNPHALYQGSSRRYWDNQVNGKIYPYATERALHHYGSGINAAVLLGAYRLFPNDTVALRAGFAASQGCLTTINASTGAPSMDWHSDPAILALDPYSADWGVGFAVAAQWFGCYLHPDADLGGVVGYGCDVAAGGGGGGGGLVNATLRDAYRRLVYVGPLGLEVRSRNAPIAWVAWDAAARTVALGLDAPPGWAGKGALPYTAVRLEVATPPAGPPLRVSSWGWAQPSAPPPLVRGAFELPAATSVVVLSYVA